MADNSQPQGSSDKTSALTMGRPVVRQAVSQKQIEQDVEGGLPNQIGRMRDAYDCLRFSQARFEEYPTRHKDQRYRSPAVRRTSPVFSRVVSILSMHLYKQQPTRKLRDPEASQWLETVYKRAGFGAKMRRCDQLTCIGGYAGYQFAGSTDPNSPVSIQLWGADQTAFWVDPNEPTKPAAVATVDFYDNQRRLRLWTKDEIVTYTTDKGVIHPAFGGTAFRWLDRKDNPYRGRDGKGIIPFAFAHWCYPAQDFETNGPGLNLKELNQAVNERLDLLGDSVFFNCRPIGIAENVDDGWTAPAELRPGDFISLPATAIDAGGNGPSPTLRYLLPELGYIEADWADLNSYLDHSLEMWGVPPSLIRMIQSGARSGASIQAEQLPILGWVEGRRSDWITYEEEFARLCVQIGECHLRNVGMQPEADQLQALLDDWSFVLRWPSLYIDLPGPAKDAADDWRLRHSQVSLVGLVKERCDMTEEEAWEQISKVAQENARLRALGIDPLGTSPAIASMMPPEAVEGEADQLSEGYDEAEPDPSEQPGPPGGAHFGDDASKMLQEDAVSAGS
jgi:hypothetical protein